MERLQIINIKNITHASGSSIIMSIGVSFPVINPRNLIKGQMEFFRAGACEV